MILSYQSIIDRCEPGRPGGPLIDPFDEAMCKSAGYDLRIGAAYYVGHECREAGDVDIRRLSVGSNAFELGSNHIALIEVHERLKLPLDLVGHITLKMDLLLKGIVMASQSQIDAGYQGHLTILIYNLSDRPATLHLLDELVRVEFARIDHDTKKPYDGDFQDEGLVVRDRITSSLTGMSKQLNRVEEDATATGEWLNATVSEATTKIDAAVADLKSSRFRDRVGALVVLATTIAIIAGLFGVLFTNQGSIQHEASDAQSAVAGIPSPLSFNSQIAAAERTEVSLSRELAQAQAQEKKEAAAVRALKSAEAAIATPSLDLPLTVPGLPDSTTMSKP